MHTARGHDTGRYVVGISGASGVRYGLRLVQRLLESPHVAEVHLIVSKGARTVAHHEEALELDTHLAQMASDHRDRLLIHDDADLAASPASGSFLHDGMFVVPSSLKTTAKIAHGIADSLIARAALVSLKEMRPLVLCPRETPLDLITIRNWATLKEAGAAIVPAMPGFYHRPQTIDDMVDHIVARLLDQMRIPFDWDDRWERPPKGSVGGRTSDADTPSSTSSGTSSGTPSGTPSGESPRTST